MASILKITNDGVVNWLRHNNRCIQNDKNKDIDISRTCKNKCLTPYISADLKNKYHEKETREKIRKLEFEHYKELKKQFYCYNRKDVNTMVSVIVTLPKEITDFETEERFFEGVKNFLIDRYGNPISITVHRDEGKHYVLKDESGNSILDDDGNPVKEWHAGRSHLHYTFIPTVKIDHTKLAKKKNPVKAMFNYSEKISSKERINRSDLKSLHSDLNLYINETCKIDCNLKSGITQKQGGNKTVEQLKAEFDHTVYEELSKENLRLKEKVHELTNELKIATEKIHELEHTKTRSKDYTIEY